MPNYSLIFARTLQHAVDTVFQDWRWYGVNELRNQFRRPDTGEQARFVPDVPSALNDLRWNTRVYLGRDWHLRNDAEKIVDLIEAGFFIKGDPELPPPRKHGGTGPSYADKVKQMAEFSRATEIRRR